MELQIYLLQKFTFIENQTFLRKFYTMKIENLDLYSNHISGLQSMVVYGVQENPLFLLAFTWTYIN